MRPKISIITHYNFSNAGPIHGPAHTVASYLSRKGASYNFIQYPLYSGAPSILFSKSKNKKVEGTFGPSFSMPLPIKSLYELIKTINFLFKNNQSYVIAVDPLNAFAAILAKKFGFIKKVVFYTVDYTPYRFSNKILNRIYHLIDLYCVYNADVVWNVSTRIMDKRKEQGVAEYKNKYVPNAPSFEVGKRLPESKVDRYNIMMVAGITHSPAFTMVIDAISKLIKKYPHVKLTIIGAGSYEQELKEKIKRSYLHDHVVFLGQLDHEKLLQELPKGGIGLAIYTRDYDWVNYGDSMKAREYFLCGLPVIITDVVSTAEDVLKHSAGIVVKSSSREIYMAIDKLMGNKRLWQKNRLNAIRLAKEFDMDSILDKEFASISSSSLKA